MRSMKGKQSKTELQDLRAENVKLKRTVSIKQDRVNDLERARTLSP